MSQNQHPIEPSGFFAFRTPLLPFEEIEAWSADLRATKALEDDNDALQEALDADRQRLRQRLGELLERPDVCEALFVASPSLFEGLEAWHKDPDNKKGRRAEESLVRYFVRMTSRATPFGLFSGCSTGTLGETTELEVVARDAYRRSTRLDMDYLFALTEEMGRDAELRRLLCYRPNTSLYSAAGRLRYAEARVDGRLRTYHLVAVDDTEYLAATLDRARSGATVETLARGLVDDDPDGEITQEEAEEFVDELIDAQLLVSDLQPIVTGPESIHELIDQFRDLAPAKRVAEHLDSVRQTLAELDENGVGNAPKIYQDVAEKLEELPAKVDLPRLFQVDMVKPARGRLGREVIEEMERGLLLLHRYFGAAPQEDSLSRFREAFQKRYEDARHVPLVEVLDEEVGIGFDRSDGIGVDASPLLRGLAFPGRPAGESTIRWGRQAELLMSKLEEVLAGDGEVLEITEKDLEGFPEDDLPPLPSAFHVMGILGAKSAEAVDAGNFEILLRGAGGPSGARLLGRFCHADPELREHVEAHLEAEEELNPDVVFAEVVHLPEGRLGNILARPRLREYEIPFLGRGAAPESHQLPIDDLLVSVVGQEVVLRSRRLGRRVLPRLTSAHNFGGRNQGIYRFLCSLQGANTRTGLGWSWGQLEGLDFLPRVTSGRLVLARARWRLRDEEIKPFVKKKDAARFRAFQELRQERGLPRRVMLADGDNELYADLDNVLSVETLLAVVKRRSNFILTELFPAPEDLVAQGPEGRFQQEVVVPFVRTAPKRSERPPARQDPARQDPARRDPAPINDTQTEEATTRRGAVRRVFPPGSEWLYAKIYTGSSTADRVLAECLAPVVRQIMGAGAADSWFFIRYSDPDWHLRLRFRGEPRRLLGEVLPHLQAATVPLVDGDYVWRIQLDTYRRETERYGGPHGIELSERLFQADSEAVLSIVEKLEGDAGADARWRLALAGTARLLTDFTDDGDEQMEIARRMQEGFAQEFRADTPFKKQLSGRLRDERRELETLLDPVYDAEHPLAPGFAALEERSRAMAPAIAELHEREAAGRLTSSVVDLVPSFVHMFNNRLLRSQARAHEVVLYDFVHQLMRSRILRERAMRKKQAQKDQAKNQKGNS